MLALTSLAIIPFGPDITIFGYTTNFGIADVNISLLVLFAITALGVYGIALAGWGSNNKYSLLGGLRSSAQMISYELALTLSVVGVLLIAGDLSLKHIVEKQAGDLGLLGRQVDVRPGSATSTWAATWSTSRRRLTAVRPKGSGCWPPRSCC